MEKARAFFDAWELRRPGAFAPASHHEEAILALAQALADERPALRSVCPDCLADHPTHREWCGTRRASRAAATEGPPFYACGNFWGPTLRSTDDPGVCRLGGVRFRYRTPEGLLLEQPERLDPGEGGPMTVGREGPCALARGHRGPCGAAGQ